MGESVGQLAERLAAGQRLTKEEFGRLISSTDRRDSHTIAGLAREVTDGTHGRRVLVRGLLETGNTCRNNCYYCGIRAGNLNVERYRLTEDETAEACMAAYGTGFRTFVLQGGEWPEDDDRTESCVRRIHDLMPDCAITLSLGERDRATYERWLKAGATRYLLRHETASHEHYRMLHPQQMSPDNRLRCLCDLKDLGYQTGAGMMAGSPGQTVDTLSEDMMLMQDLQPEMAGIGPFIPHHDTPMAGCRPGSLELTLRLVSLTRLMLPDANIPATTALATIDPRGREYGLMAGANVVMPNITPPRCRELYELYDNKAMTGAESAEGLRALTEEIERIGLTADMGRGDFKKTTKRRD